MDITDIRPSLADLRQSLAVKGTGLRIVVNVELCLLFNDTSGEVLLILNLFGNNSVF